MQDKIILDVFDKDGNFIGKKGFYVNLNSQTLNQWIKKFESNCDKIGILMADAPDFQHNNHIAFINEVHLLMLAQFWHPKTITIVTSEITNRRSP